MCACYVVGHIVFVDLDVLIVRQAFVDYIGYCYIHSKVVVAIAQAKVYTQSGAVIAYQVLKGGVIEGFWADHVFVDAEKGKAGHCS